MARSGPQNFSVCPHDTANGLEKWAIFHTITARVSPCGSRYVPYFNFKEFDVALQGEQIRWGYLNPAQFLTVRKLFGYVPIARPVQRPDKAIFVRTMASPVTRLEDIRDKRIVAAPGYLFALAKQALKVRGVDFTHVPAKSYSEVMGALAKGEADIGISYNEHFDALTPSTRSQFAIVDVVDPGLTHVICMHPAVPEDVRESLRRFLLEAPGNPDGQRAMSVVGIKGFEPVDTQPFDALAQILAAS